MTTPPEPGHPDGEPDPSTQPMGYWEGQAHQPPPASGYPPPPPGNPPPEMAYPVAPGQPGRVPDHPKATTALVVGLIALVGGLVCAVPLVAGPWAWVIGRRAVRQIDAEPTRFGGRGVAMAGYVLGVIATILLLLGIIAFVGLIALLIAAPSGSFSEGSTVTSL